jgi:hypothetical protein
VHLSDLNAKQLSLIDPKDQALLKVKPVTEEQLEAKCAKLEGKEHDVVMAWASRNGLYIIHASCRRRVHDLPPGWPDFALVYGNRVACVEMKVHTKPRVDQVRTFRELDSQGTDVKITWSADETIRYFSGWLWEHFRWMPV